MVVGSDRVKEMKEKLEKYNGTHKGALYNFKKIRVHSAGQRDPDAEGTTGMSGTKMRDAASEKRFHDVKNKEGKVVKPGFRSGVPEHVSDEHAHELMHDVRKGMGLHESINRGLFKAIFITGGPNSGKDVIIREAIASNTITELNLIQARDYLADKQKLSEKSNDYRRESIRNRGPLIINGPADDNQKINYIKEELEELGYQTMMVFVNTTDEVSKERNSMLSRMMTESVRHDKWVKSQQVTRQYQEMYNNFMVFDNTGDLNDKEFDIHVVYENTKEFLDNKIINETAIDWMTKHNKFDISHTINRLFEEKTNAKENNRFLKIKTNPACKAAGPGDIPADNRASEPNADDIKWDGGYKKRGSYIFKTYESSEPKIKIRPEPKETNFDQDKETKKIRKFGDRSGKEPNNVRPSGLGSEWNTRTNGSGLTGGAGLGNQTYSESQEYSNANPSSTAFPSGGSPNPLSSDYDVPKKKTLRKFRQESIDSPGEVAMGVYGTMGGASNKEPMETYADRKNGIEISKKKKRLKEDQVKELENGLMNLQSHSYDSIDMLMKRIADKHNITGKDLHNDFEKKHGKAPDDWIKEKK